MILAHGIGGRGDLPIPFWLFSWQVAFAIAVSFIILAFFWRSPKLERSSLEFSLGARASLAGNILAYTARTLSLVIFFTVLYAALFGKLGSTATIAPVAVYVIFWVGLVLVSFVLGDSWRVLSPWDTLAAAVLWLKAKIKAKPAPDSKPKLEIVPPSSEVNAWLAVCSLFAFLWLELIHPDSANTRLLGVLILFYTIYLLAGAALWGRSWVREADAFAQLHRLIGSLGIFVRRRHLNIRPPLVGSAEPRLGIAQTAFILVFLGSTSFDGITSTSFWEELQGSKGGWSDVPLNSFGLIVVIMGLAAAYMGAMYLAARLTKTSALELACYFGNSLIPIALAYSAAHYFSLLIFEGQDFVSLLSDPFGQGWNLFGTRHININYQIVSTSTISWIQAMSILVGHIWAVFLAHDRAVLRWPNDSKSANRSQYGLILVMVGYTILGLFLLLKA